ncbi:MAG: PD-(D/E)XK nuclease family protein [Bryobacteraceae bacterium]
MLLMTGPAGAGLTAEVLRQLRELLLRGESNIRLLVPTATMAEHIRNLLAREGFVLRPNLILTLSQFIAPWVEDLPQASGPALYLLVEKVIKTLDLPAFERVADRPGFITAVAQVVEEFSTAGCDSDRLARNLPETPFAPPFLQVYRAVERALFERGWGMRSARLMWAASNIRSQGLPGIGAVWIDGFFAFAEPELEVVKAIAARARVTVTLPLAPGGEAARTSLLRAGAVQQTFPAVAVSPAVTVFHAPTEAREADEIATRIVAEARMGREFREIGIVVRNPEIYLPLLRASLERFGIPARFYFSAMLADHAIARFLCGVVRSLLSGWSYAETLAALRLAEGSGSDAFDFTVREKLPGRGLGGLRELAGGNMEVARLLDGFAEIEAWRGQSHTPAVWSERLKTLRSLVHEPRPGEDTSREQAALWRGQSSALEAFDTALDEAAKSLAGAGRIALTEFFETVNTVMRLTPLRVPDRRRNVVHVLSVYEARQWELPAVYVCGMVERQFPRSHNGEPLFPEAARLSLVRAGIRVRTAAEHEREERFLFDLASTRATRSLTLSYSETDSRGTRNLPSLYLDARPSEPAGEFARPAAQLISLAGPVAIRNPELLAWLMERHKVVSPSSIESFVDCPYQFFSGKTLRLRTRPLRPEERLDFLLQGGIVHLILAEWTKQRQDIEPLFDRLFAAECESKSVRMGYRTEVLRRQMLDNIRRFTDEVVLPLSSETRTEEKFLLKLDETLSINGRIDRLEILPGKRALIIDYKSSGAERLGSNLKKLQGPLYVLAVERCMDLRPVGMLYIGLKKVIKRVGWAHPDETFGEGLAELTPELGDVAGRTVKAIVSEVREGRIEPKPASIQVCGWCDFRSVCRYDIAVEGIAAAAK